MSPLECFKAYDIRGRVPAELNEDVEFTGYFFKRWAYRAKDGTRLAPLVLARAPVWTPPTFAAVEQETPSAAWIVVAICGTMALGVVVSILAYLRSNWTSASRYHRSRGISPQSLAGADHGDVGQSLRSLADRAREDASNHAEQ